MPLRKPQVDYQGDSNQMMMMLVVDQSDAMRTCCFSRDVLFVVMDLPKSRRILITTLG